MWSDMMGFLAPQGAELRTDFEADPNLDLECIGVTASPPPPFGGTLNWEILGNICSFKDRLIANSLCKIQIVRTQEDLEVDGLKVVLCLQHPPVDSIDGLAEAGVLMCGLAYTGENQYGSGFANPTGGLTDVGRTLIEDMSTHKGMVLDLAHASERTSHDALDHIERYSLPIHVVISHTGCASVYPHPRNVSDELMKRVAVDHNSLVGIYSLTFALSEDDDSPASFAEHVKHAVDVCGEDHVAIGSDGIHRKRRMDEWEAHTAGMIKSLGSKASVFAPRFPDQPLEFNSAQKMSAVAGEIVTRTSLSFDTVCKICNTNYLNFLKRILS